MTDSQNHAISIIAKYQHILTLEQHIKEDFLCFWVSGLSKEDMAILDAYMDSLSDLKCQLKTTITS